MKNIDAKVILRKSFEMESDQIGQINITCNFEINTYRRKKIPKKSVKYMKCYKKKTMKNLKYYYIQS